MDYETLLEMCGGDHKMIRNAVAYYPESSREAFVLMQAGVESEDHKKVRMAAHRLKCIASQLCCYELSGLCESLEKMTYQEPPSFCEDLIERIRSTSERTWRELEEIIL